MEIHLLSDIVIILGLSVLIILLFQRLKLPSILGFLITGIIVGPHGLNMIKAVHEVELLSEIGVIFLLFVIGIEFSLKGLSSIKRTVLFGGSVQVLGTIGIVTLACWSFGLSVAASVFMGFLISLSSTAIVLKMLQEKGELSAPHGRVSIGILIFQDIIVVLMILLTPMLAGQLENPGLSLLILFGKVALIIVAVFLLARYIVPVLFGWVVRTKSRELFILTVVVLCFSTAWLTSSAGLSLALGAFFAGLIISESDYSHQANANILPFREIFISFFFVSVGMLLDLSFFVDNIVLIHFLAFGVMFLKFAVVGVTVYLLGNPSRTILYTALTLFQVGEFAFVLASAGMDYQLLSENMYQYFLSISIISMGATPFVIKYSPKIADLILKVPLPKPVSSGLNAMAGRQVEVAGEDEYNFEDHLIIVGYGMNGKNVARAARKANISYVVVELDAQSFGEAKANKVPVVFGDASEESILKLLNIQRARVVVIAISDPEATRRIVQMIRTFTETAYIMVRTRYVREVEEIIRLGADEVVPEEFETSIEIFTRVLKKYLVPNNQIQSFTNEIRSRNYEMLRTKNVHENVFETSQIQVSDMKVATLPVQQGKNRIVGKTISESGILKEFNIAVVAIKRGEEYFTNISDDLEILQDDLLYIFGLPDDISRINKYCAFSEN